MNFIVRQETQKEIDSIYKVVKAAFKSAEHSDGTEQDLVNKLRTSDSYIEDLSLVALDGNLVVGHIMFTKAIIQYENNKYETLALAPLSVCPTYQRKGVGSKLIKEGLKKAADLGYNSVIVLGSEKYYPRFGFKEAINFGIKAPFEVPSENFMAIELQPEGLKNISGTVIYPKEFFE